MTFRDDLRAAAPEFFGYALGEKSPALSAFVTADGRVGRQTIHGLEWVGLIAGSERRALDTLLEPLFARQSSCFQRDSEGNVLAAFRDQALRTQTRVSLVPPRRLGADDFAAALPPELFFFLQSLVRLGENVWILGDTGAEFELGCALVPDTHTLLARPPADRPPPYQAPMLADMSLAEALLVREQGAFSTLVYAGELGAAELELLGQRSGVVLSQRCTSVERALARAGLLQRQDLAQQLPALTCVVQLQRSHTFGVQVAQIAEFRRNTTGVDFVPVATRGLLPDARVLTLVQQPQSMQRLVEGGIDNVVLALSEAADEEHPIAFRPSPAADRTPHESDDESDAPLRGEMADIDHEDPGWELDAKPSSREGLVQAPGGAGTQGMFRARPVVRPSTRRADQDEDSDEPKIGELTLDPPARKIMIPEAPSGVTQKRTFAEIMRERHRFPPMSEKGPTLSPPVLADDGSGDDDITP